MNSNQSQSDLKAQSACRLFRSAFISLLTLPIFLSFFSPSTCPQIPLFSISSGSLLTCGALVLASYQLRKGNKAEFNRALRWRVGFQGITVLSAVVGSLYYGAKATQSSDPNSAKVETMPGRPATNFQVERAEEKKKEDGIMFRQRMKEMEDKDVKERRMVEDALMGESAKGTGKSGSEKREGSLFRNWFGSGDASGDASGKKEEVRENKSPLRDEKGRPIIGMDSRR